MTRAVGSMPPALTRTPKPQPGASPEHCRAHTRGKARARGRSQSFQAVSRSQRTLTIGTNILGKIFFPNMLGFGGILIIRFFYSCIVFTREQDLSRSIS